MVKGSQGVTWLCTLLWFAFVLFLCLLSLEWTWLWASCNYCKQSLAAMHPHFGMDILSINYQSIGFLVESKRPNTCWVKNDLGYYSKHVSFQAFCIQDISPWILRKFAKKHACCTFPMLFYQATKTHLPTPEAHASNQKMSMWDRALGIEPGKN